MLNHFVDLLVLGTNKGVIVYKLANNIQPDVIPSMRLTELNDYTKFVTFEMNKTNLISQIYQDNAEKGIYEYKSEYLIKDVFLSQTGIVKLKRIKLEFSYDENYMSVVDSIANNFTIYSVNISEAVKYSFSSIRTGNAIDLQWCPYESIFAILLHNQIGKIIDYKKLIFTAAVYKLSGTNVQLLYSIERYICVLIKCILS
jgi:hypothetical protein